MVGYTDGFLSHSFGSRAIDVRVARTPFVPVLAAVEAVDQQVTESDTATPSTPDVLNSDVGADYQPLVEALQEKRFKDADQITRDMLIYIAGPEARKRKFVYWTEVKKLPKADMATMERLWLKYSDGRFGYTIQRKLWRTQKGDFEAFCRKIGWNVVDEDLERKRRWFGNDEFIYDLEAPKGHLPLTSALRGTMLLKEILQHPVWEEEEFQA